MKQNDLILFGGLAVGAYLLYKNMGNTSTLGGGGGVSQTPLVSPANLAPPPADQPQAIVDTNLRNQTVTAYSRTKYGALKATPITNSNGVAYINQTLQSGGTLLSNDTLLAKNVTAVDKKTGQVYTNGQIVLLAGQSKPSFISVITH